MTHESRIWEGNPIRDQSPFSNGVYTYDMTLLEGRLSLWEQRLLADVFEIRINARTNLEYLKHNCERQLVRLVKVNNFKNEEMQKPGSVTVIRDVNKRPAQ